MPDAYHHGSLREAVLAAAAPIVAEQGPSALSLRDVARRAGVSHAAPAYHFGDLAGLFTALAVQGFARLAEQMRPSVDAGDFLATAVAYVRFAIANPGHFRVMFRSELLRRDDPELERARSDAAGLLSAGLATVPAQRLVIEPDDAYRVAWATVHGVASMTIDGVFPAAEAEKLTRAAARQLFG